MLITSLMCDYKYIILAHQRL